MSLWSLTLMLYTHGYMHTLDSFFLILQVPNHPSFSFTPISHFLIFLSFNFLSFHVIFIPRVLHRSLGHLSTVPETLRYISSCSSAFFLRFSQALLCIEDWELLTARCLDGSAGVALEVFSKDNNSEYYGVRSLLPQIDISRILYPFTYYIHSVPISKRFFFVYCSVE